MTAQSIVRPPAVAGKFYPAKPEVLRRDAESYLPDPGEKITALGCMVPHAGYMYSGAIAGSIHARLSPLRGIVRRVGRALGYKPGIHGEDRGGQQRINPLLGSAQLTRVIDSATLSSAGGGGTTAPTATKPPPNGFTAPICAPANMSPVERRVHAFPSSDRNIGDPWA